jgi:hypothetical protein
MHVSSSSQASWIANGLKRELMQKIKEKSHPPSLALNLVQSRAAKLLVEMHLVEMILVAMLLVAVLPMALLLAFQVVAARLPIQEVRKQQSLTSAEGQGSLSHHLYEN